MSLPRGVTHKHIVSMFLRGLDMADIAHRIHCSRSAVEDVIRAVLNRQKGRTA
jgi:predicted DNA-binding protein YlxM (UPF0122 family)